ncbi:MAG: AI-2E family transporter [Clostridiales bacterium]|nr:AI-2E family transporter [Clostridiales bacterium]
MSLEDKKNSKSSQEEQPPEEQPREKERGPWDIRSYLAVGLTAILVIFVSLLLFFFLFRFEGFSSGVGEVIRSLNGIIIGLVLAYLLNPGMRFFERRFQKKLFTKGGQTLKQKRIIRGLSVACIMVIFLAIIAVLLALLVPQLVMSVQELVLSLNEKFETLEAWIERLIRNNHLADQMENLADEIFSWLEDWLQTTILDNGSDLVATLTAGVYSVIKMLFNFLVGIIVALYVLMKKEQFVGQTKKLIYAVFKPRRGNIIMEVAHKADEVFGGFFVGKVIDSLIIGCICFVCMYIMKMPYTILVSVIVGVTNIIPFFGPFIGAIPSVILIFLVSPIKAVYFLILIVVLQQVDGNIIGPKILGDSTGLSPFWIIFSILLFGGCFGFIGMILGVPVFALIYYIVKRLAEHFLRKRGLPEETADYVRLSRVDEETLEIQEHGDDKRLVIQSMRRKKRKEEKEQDT